MACGTDGRTKWNHSLCDWYNKNKLQTQHICFYFLFNTSVYTDKCSESEQQVQDFWFLMLNEKKLNSLRQNLKRILHEKKNCDDKTLREHFMRKNIILWVCHSLVRRVTGVMGVESAESMSHDYVIHTNQQRNSGGWLQYKDYLSRNRDSHYKDMTPWDCIIFIMGIFILVRLYLYTEMAPRWLQKKTVTHQALVQLRIFWNMSLYCNSLLLPASPVILVPIDAGIILGMGSANERRYCYVTPSLIG